MDAHERAIVRALFASFAQLASAAAELLTDPAADESPLSAAPDNNAAGHRSEVEREILRCLEPGEQVIFASLSRHLEKVVKIHVPEQDLHGILRLMKARGEIESDNRGFRLAGKRTP